MKPRRYTLRDTWNPQT